MEDLDESTVIRAGQRPALFIYVPLNFFIVEAIVALMLFGMFKFWVVVFAPIHLIPVLKTAMDFHWLTTLQTNWTYWWYMIQNKGIKKKGVVTFCASPVKPSKRDYLDFQ